MFIHHINPVAISLGPLQIYWYGLAYVVAICCCWYQARRFAPQFNITPNVIDDSITYWILGIIVGGRLGYILFYDTHIIMHAPLQIFKTWQGGMSFHGGFIGAVIAVWLYCKKHNINRYAFGDVIAIAAPLGLFFGRIANFINAEHCGRPTTLPVGVIFPTVDNLPRHASQLYEALGEGLLLWAFLRCTYHLFKKKTKPGLFIFLFIMGYGILRFILEYFRTPDAIINMFCIPISIGQVLSLPMMIVGAIGLLIIHHPRFSKHHA